MARSFVDEVQAAYLEQRQQLYIYALSITRNREHAEDAIHTAFAAILRRGKAPRELRPYIFRSVRNAALDALKASSNGHIHTSLFENESAPDPSVPILIQEALAKLTDHEREAIVMKIYSGMTLKEIAAAYEVSINTSASWYRRGLEKLRGILEEVPHERD